MDDTPSDLRDLVDSHMRSVYSEATIDHAMNPRNCGVLHGADGWARYTGPCGDTMEIWITVRGGRITKANFWTDGCGTSIACGSMVTVLAEGRSVESCLELGQQDVLDALGGLPEESSHCALLAAVTLKLAIADHLNSPR